MAIVIIRPKETAEAILNQMEKLHDRAEKLDLLTKEIERIKDTIRLNFLQAFDRESDPRP